MELLSCSYDNEGWGSNDGCQRAGNEEGIMDNTPRNSFSFQSVQILKIFFLRNEQRWHFYPLGLEAGRCTISKINNSWLIWCRCQPQLSKQGQRGCQQFKSHRFTLSILAEFMKWRLLVCRIVCFSFCCWNLCLKKCTILC